MSARHGGPDDGPFIHWDFSTNANPLPAPEPLMAALLAADRRRYPDPSYTAVRTHLAQALGCEPRRLLVTAGSSEAIRRLTLAARLEGIDEVWVPWPGYGDYQEAAEALGLPVRRWENALALLAHLEAGSAHPPDVHSVVHPDVPMDIHKPARRVLVWLCEPCNPTGGSLPAAFWARLDALLPRQSSAGDRQVVVALDRAYEPLRLMGGPAVPVAVAERCWQLWSPNKALGLTGVRAGCLVAPVQALDGADAALLDRLGALAPSWVASAEGVAMLQAWHTAETQDWLRRCLPTLADWRAALLQSLHRRGWDMAEASGSVTHFVTARPPQGVEVDALLPWLRRQGIKLRDTRSLGLPGRVRVAAQGPDALKALEAALDAAPSARAGGSAPDGRAAAWPGSVVPHGRGRA